MPRSDYIDFRALKRQVTMLQVLEHYGLLDQMRRQGDSLTGRCPIHDGDNPTAFRVSVSKNCWNCFSRCQCGGNVLDFVAKKEKVSLPKAARLLVEWFNLHLDAPAEAAPARDEPAPSRVRDKNTAASEPVAPRPAESPPEPEEQGDNKPLEFTLKNLQPEHPYLTERGLTPETVRTFGLGYCTKGILKGRIAIPIQNAGGQLVAYAGRWPGVTNQEKYQFPKGFKKSLELFNLHRAMAEPADRPLVIVEGFFDVMKLWQHGVRRVIALMGSHLSAAQEASIRRHTHGDSLIQIALDEDDAGRKGREDLARRLARFSFVKIVVFELAGTQPDNLSAEQIGVLFTPGGAA